VENRRGADQRVIQRQVLYLGEINDSQNAAWCQGLEVLEPLETHPETPCFCTGYDRGGAVLISDVAPASSRH